MDPHHAVEREGRQGLAAGREGLSGSAGLQHADRSVNVLRELRHATLQILLEGADPAFRSLEAPKRQVRRGGARFSQRCCLLAELLDGLFVELPERLPLVLDGPFELLDALARVLLQPVLESTPLAESLLEARDDFGMLLVGLPPAIHYSRALLGELLRGAAPPAPSRPASAATAAA